jgi:hypothetical protein
MIFTLQSGVSEGFAAIIILQATDFSGASQNLVRFVPDTPSHFVGLECFIKDPGSSGV